MTLNKKKIKERIIVLFALGLILFAWGLIKFLSPGIGYSNRIHQFYINNGTLQVLLGIGFILGSYIQFRSLRKK